MSSLLKKYGYVPDSGKMRDDIDRIAANLDVIKTDCILKECFSMMDLTSLRANDTPSGISKLVGKVNGLASAYPSYPLPASVCVYPNFASVVRDTRNSEDLHVTVVSGCFPASQSFIEVKVKESEMAVADGADEVDVVISIGEFLNGEYDLMGNEIEMPERDVEISSLELLSFDGREAVIRTSVSKGTYIRSLARDIASAAGSAGHLSHLRRLRIGPWRLEDIGRSTWDLLSSAGLFSEIKLSERERKRIENGTIVPGAILSDSAPERPYAFLRFSDELYGIGEKRDGRLRIIERLS